MNKKKYYLTEEQQAWLREVFPNTNNAHICEVLGFSYGTLRRMARDMGLQKTAEFKRLIAINANIKSQASNWANGYYESLKGKPVPNGEATRFRKGESTIERWGKEMNDLRVQRIAATRKKEKARVIYGLPQKTRMRVVKTNPRKQHNKDWLAHCGYLRDEDDPNILYYPADIKRHYKAEATAASLDIKILPLSNNLEANGTNN